MLAYSVVDAFTASVFKGNPAVVIVTDAALSVNLMQSIASEFNLSETAFLVERPGDNDESSIQYSIRWFTPSVEAPLCGHASLASSFILFGQHPTKSSITFHSQVSGTLIAKRLPDGRIELDFPAFPTKEIRKDSEEFKRIQKSINETVVDPSTVESAVESEGIEVSKLARGLHGYVVEIAKAVNLAGLQVDALKLAQDAFDHGKVEGDLVIITQPSSTPGVDINSRVFAPEIGVPEDPVTGAAHCLLAPYWLDPSNKGRLSNFVTYTLQARQVSARGGELEVTLVRSDEGADRVKLKGRAVVVMDGKLHVPLE